jgi:energy-converting hydrogenase Eha subunit E
MRRPLARPRGPGSAILWDLLTFEKLMTAQVVHLIYWSGLAMIALGVFGFIGAAIGLAIRDPSLLGLLMVIPAVVFGLLAMAVAVLLWRSLCEFYVAIFKISEDLGILRADVEAERAAGGGPQG